MNIRDRQARARQFWIGMVEVRPLKGSSTLKDAKGAFVNVVTWASDAEEYGRKANLVFGELGLFIVDIENPEPVSIRRKKASLDEEIEDIISSAEGNPNAIIYSTFLTWDRDTA